MVLPEFSFCLLSSLVLTKVNFMLMLAWETFNKITNWAVGVPAQSLKNKDLNMFSWCDNKSKLFEIILFVIFCESIFNISSCFQSVDRSQEPEFQFGYRKNNGPSMWKEHYVNALGDKQSPINIVVNDSMQCPCGPLIWNNFYELPELMMIHNDGYSIAVNGQWTNGKPEITGLPLNNECYVFNRLYFHWGPTDTEGSEHTIDYERFPLELHMIFLKDGYSNPMEAHYDQNPNGIVIVAFLFEITPVDNPGFLSIIIDNLNNVKNPKSSCHIQPFSLNDIYPQFDYNYYKYEGSITQPPCSEIVTYIIQSETIAVSKRQMSRFRKLLAIDGKPMLNNSRPVQKLNDRTVFYFTS
ncbi:carbonic anhydrase, putative [Pediculus humanus corporis]|uniref:Carbonic anhydrase n=1 Tax=Pediculus humanus subsp. corporis TaxID=121224 RepID=E0VKB8_PEDHC|nr:carbonic anhydrase, putative [Pediculus humanus corporis]EEB13824.1 carbonic anhydrase, putative [Pediculus humanus corporis]